MNLLEEHQPTDLEQLASLSRRRFIGAGALCGAALFLGGNLLSRSVMAASVSTANSSLLGFASIPAATADRWQALTLFPRMFPNPPCVLQRCESSRMFSPALVPRGIALALSLRAVSSLGRLRATHFLAPLRSLLRSAYLLGAV